MFADNDGGKASMRVSQRSEQDVGLGSALPGQRAALAHVEVLSDDAAAKGLDTTGRWACRAQGLGREWASSDSAQPWKDPPLAGGLVALLDDVAVLARAAAASIDDIGAAAAKAGAKAAGVVVDDAAVTPQYVRSLAAERELPIIKRIAVGSLRNKFFIILPAVLLLSQFVPWLLTPILMLGGAYLCYEGAEKVWAKIAHRDAHGAGEEEVQDETTLV
ncbi:DUF808 family protein, partial [Micromonospora sp. NPDC005324]|uniref:DUF808 family protein n=1 Tax=Micromonospora sp. NPDC005324 TaxID=3157033 RepID=UPI0033AAEC6A